jgi:voltage-gated potassium channel
VGVNSGETDVADVWDEKGESARYIRLPHGPRTTPLRQVLRRMLLANAVLFLTTFAVYLGRAGYRDSARAHLDFLGSFYYATVTLSTTGYGDITPASDTARLVNALLITPMRVIFLIILVGTTLEVLTTRTRRQWRLDRWRSRVEDHTVVVGYGTKGRHAVESLLGQGVPRERIVVVDPVRRVVDAACHDGLAGVLGEGTRSSTLRRAMVERAAKVVVAVQRDDAAVLTTLTVRQLNQRATVVASAREDENAPLLRQSGADVVITSSSSAGRLLGLAALSPFTGEMLEDLLTYGNGLDVVDREITPAEVGRPPTDCRDLVVGVVRDGRLFRHGDPELATLQSGDRIIAIKRVATPPGAAPRT